MKTRETASSTRDKMLLMRSTYRGSGLAVDHRREELKTREAASSTRDKMLLMRSTYRGSGLAADHEEEGGVEDQRGGQ